MNMKMIKTMDGDYVNKAAVLDIVLNDKNFERVLKDIIVLGTLSHMKNLTSEFALFTRDVEKVNRAYAKCEGEICMHFKKYFNELDNTITTHRNRMGISYIELTDMVEEFSRDPESEIIMNNLKMQVKETALRN